MRKQTVPGFFRYNLGATIDPRIVQELDARRGQVPRSRIIESALIQYLRHTTNDKGEQKKNGVRGQELQSQPATTTSDSANPPTAIGEPASIGR